MSGFYDEYVQQMYELGGFSRLTGSSVLKLRPKVG